MKFDPLKNTKPNVLIIDIKEQELMEQDNKTIVLHNSRRYPRFRTSVNIATLPGFLLYLPATLAGSVGLACGNNLASFIYWNNTKFHKVLSQEIGIPSAITLSLFNLYTHTDFLNFFKKHPLPAALTYGAGLGMSVPSALFTYNGLPNYPSFLRWFLSGSTLIGLSGSSALGMRRAVISPLLSCIKAQNEPTFYKQRRYTKHVTVIVVLLGTSAIMGIVTNIGSTGLAIKNLSLGWKIVVGACNIPNTLTFISSVYDTMNPILPDSGEARPLLSTREEIGFFEKYLPILGDFAVPVTALGCAADNPWFFQSTVCGYDAPIWEKNCGHDWWGLMGGVGMLTYVATLRGPAKKILGKIGWGLDWLMSRVKRKPKAKR